MDVVYNVFCTDYTGCMDRKTFALKRTTFFKRLNAPYRLVFIDDASLKEVASVSLTKTRVYIYASTLFVLTSAITVLILVLTPLRFYVPGYGSGKTHRNVIQLKRQVDSLADIVSSQDAYAANIRKVINGSYDGNPDTTALDLNEVHREAMRGILPKAEEIRRNALGSQPAQGKKKKR